jgi:hypothetical protein
MYTLDANIFVRDASPGDPDPESTAAPWSRLTASSANGQLRSCVSSLLMRLSLSLKLMVPKLSVLTVEETAVSEPSEAGHAESRAGDRAEHAV